MQIFAGGSTMGGSVDGFRTPLEDAHPIENPQEVEEAIAYAVEALDAAQHLEDASLNYEQADPTASKLLDIAVEGFIERFQIPAAALESEDDDTNDDGSQKKEAGRLKKVVLYLYAVVERIFKAIFDLLTNHKADARKVIPQTKLFIGQVDSFSSSIARQLNIKDKSLMLSLHIDGLPPQKVTELYDQLATAFEKQYRFSAVADVVRVVEAAEKKDFELVNKEAEELRKRLEAGLQETLKEVDPKTMPIFTDKIKEGTHYYASTPMFGQNYITGMVGDAIRSNGTFTFHCGVRRDTEVPLRMPTFPVLTPDEIRAVCRISKRICENIIRFARDEELLKKALRQAQFLRSKSADKAAVVALRNMTAVGQNSYIVYLRYTTSTMKALMRWCAQSIAQYEGTGR